MAWELPNDPGDFDMFRDQYKVFEGKRRSDVLYYVDEDGKVVDKIDYKRYFKYQLTFCYKIYRIFQYNICLAFSQRCKIRWEKAGATA